MCWTCVGSSTTNKIRQQAGKKEAKIFPTKPKHEIISEDAISNITFEELKYKMPTKQEIDIEISSYYLNNRKVFVNYINSLVLSYRKDINNELSCKDKDNHK